MVIIVNPVTSELFHSTDVTDNNITFCDFAIYLFKSFRRIWRQENNHNKTQLTYNLKKQIFNRMPIKKTLILNGKEVEAWVPDSKISREEALKRFKQDIKEIVARKVAMDESKKVSA